MKEPSKLSGLIASHRDSTAIMLPVINTCRHHTHRRDDTARHADDRRVAFGYT